MLLLFAWATRCNLPAYALPTEGYNVEPTSAALFLANATDVVRRYRTHPSIAIWCPRNEGYAPAALGGLLAQLIIAEGGTHYY